MDALTKSEVIIAKVKGFLSIFSHSLFVFLFQIGFFELERKSLKCFFTTNELVDIIRTYSA